MVKRKILSNRIVSCKVQNCIKTGAFTVFGRNLWPKDNRYQYWQLSILTGVKKHKKNIFTIEFTTHGLRKVQNLIKIERFAVFGPKLWPKRWQVPISTGVNIDRRQESQKVLSPLNSRFSICVEFQISSKLKLLQLLLKTIVSIEFTTICNYGLRDDRCQCCQVSKNEGVENHKTYCRDWIYYPHFVLSMKFHQNSSICCFSSKTMAYQMTGANIDRCQYLQASKIQKTIATIEFTALDLCRVRDSIKIEAFVVLRPKLWPEWWQVPILVSQKTIVINELSTFKLFTK